MAECANYSCSASNKSISSNASVLLTPRPAFTKGIPSPNPSQGGQGIDWEKIMPNLTPYSLTHKRDNYHETTQKARQNINFKDIIENNQYQGKNILENRTNTPLASPTPLALSIPINQDNQRTMPGYQSNSQGAYGIAA